MINRVLGILVMSGAVTTASADESLEHYILERAASCWMTPTALRGVSFSANIHVNFTREGHVKAIEVANVAPATETFKGLAHDFADAFERCSPYITEGMNEMNFALSWPL